MRVELNKSNKYLVNIINSNLNVTNGMKKLISYCEERCPNEKESWKFLKQQDFPSEIIDFKNWLENILTHEPIRHDVVEALWFGMFSLDSIDDKGCGLYLAGIEKFNLRDDAGDWILETIYFPGQYFRSDILHQLHIFMTQGGEWAFEVGEYLLCLGYVSLLIRQTCEDINTKLLAGNKNSCPILVGFDSGEFMYLGNISRSGWIDYSAKYGFE